MDLPTVEHALMFSRSYAAASPYLGKTARAHITGLCDLLEATQARLLAKDEKDRESLQPNANSPANPAE